MMQTKTTLFRKSEDVLNTLDIKTIEEDRKGVLQSLSNHIQSKVKRQEDVLLNFVCTHNSRRSQLAQVWAGVLATHFDLPNVYTYSGGTEATAMFPLVKETLKSQGMEILTLSRGKNPVYAVKYGENIQPIILFSKVYDHAFNPNSDFTAVLTCSEADNGCPFIEGAEMRFSIAYDDPKAFDQTPLQLEKYNTCSLQIATELFYVFSKIKKN